MIIKSPDTDVAIIACYQAYNALNIFSEIWFETETSSNLRYIPIHEIVNDLGATISNILPIFHYLNGCDSTASFFGIGKKKAFTILKQKMDNLLFLNGLGEYLYIDIKSDYVKDAMQFICWLYDLGAVDCNINSLRYKLFCSKNVSGEKLPLMQLCFMLLEQHIKRLSGKIQPLQS